MLVVVVIVTVAVVVAWASLDVMMEYRFVLMEMASPEEQLPSYAVFHQLS